MPLKSYSFIISSYYIKFDTYVSRDTTVITCRLSCFQLLNDYAFGNIIQLCINKIMMLIIIYNNKTFKTIFFVQVCTSSYIVYYI